jgi:hypothetical protein
LFREHMLCEITELRALFEGQLAVK